MATNMRKEKKQTDDRSAVSDSFLENQTFLKKFITRFFSNKEDVEDVVQETYLRAYVAEQKTQISQHKSFLFRTAKNIALTKLTRKSKKVTDFLEDYSRRNDWEHDPTPDEIVDAQQQLTIYCAAVETLNGKCREAFLLKKVHGMTNKEIAKQMSLSMSSIEKYLHHAMIACDDYILKSNGEFPYSASVQRMSGHREKTKK